jgi:hypothetical protein
MIAAVVYVESLSIAGATVAGKDLALFIDPNPRGLPRGVRGVLGDDFLQRFDVLIDYRHLVLRLESAPGSMAETLRGEHLPIQLNGNEAGERTVPRLTVTGQIREFGVNSFYLLLDSGTANFVLFRKGGLGFGSQQQLFVDPTYSGSLNHVWVETRNVRSLRLGKSLVDDLTVVAFPNPGDPQIDGLMPTSRFHSIFISHQGRFVILNPSSPKLPAKTLDNTLVGGIVRDPHDFPQSAADRPPTTDHRNSFKENKYANDISKNDLHPGVVSPDF